MYIVNPRLSTRFGLISNYTFMSSPSMFEEVEGDIHTDVETDRHTLIYKDP